MANASHPKDMNIKQIRILISAPIYHFGAYNQTKSSRELYDLVKTLETYKQVIDPSTTLVLTTESELYQLLNGVGQQP